MLGFGLITITVLLGVLLAGEDRAREAVGGAPVDELQRLSEPALRIDVRRHDGAEQLLAHRPEVGILRLQDGRFDEVPLRVVVAAADEDVDVGARLGLLDRLLLRLERAGVDDGAHEVLKVADVSHADRPHLLDHALADLARGRIDALRPVAPAAPAAATSRAIAGTSVPDADAMMIIARRTRTDPCFPRRTICSSRRQLRTWACRSCSSGEAQLNTGTSVRICTPVSAAAFFVSAISASSAFG